MKCQNLVSEKNKKVITNLLAVEFVELAKRVITAKVSVQQS